MNLYHFCALTYTTGKDSSLDGAKGHTHSVVMKLVEGLEKKGHHIYCDNFYSSPALFTNLRENGFCACGTLRINRRGVPSRIKSKVKLKKGDVVSIVKKGTLYLKWMNKRIVTVMSTIHSSSRMLSIQHRTRHAATGQENIRKPEVIVDYNKLMGAQGS